jgi:hypothetical protein
VEAFYRERVGGALFNPPRRYRYALTRQWDDLLSPCMFIGLNPSTADARRDDHTIRRCANYARMWGHGGIIMVNLFAYRETDPRILPFRIAEGVDIVGAENDGVIRHLLGIDGLRVVAAWGHDKLLNDGVREAAVASLVEASGRTLECLGRTLRTGRPRHPSRTRADAPLVAFRPVTV